MASHVVVIDTSFRRATVKVTPAKYLTDILEEACHKFGLEDKLYSLKYKAKPLDLSLNFRQSGLASGAKLDLVQSSRTPTPVSVALQLPETLKSGDSNGRLTDKFPSDTTLWLILRKFESIGGSNLNLTARVSQTETGPAVYEQPTLHIMSRNLATFEDLQKTLGQLGFTSGTCLVRLDFKRTNMSLEEAKRYIRDYFKDEFPKNHNKSDSCESAHVSNSKVSELKDFDDAQKELNAFPISSSQSTAPPKLDLNHRAVSIYSPPSGPIPRAATIPDDDADYELTLAHAKLHQRRLLDSSQNKYLLSEQEIELREREKAEKIERVHEVSIKIRFPDQSSVVSTFTADETGASLHAFVVTLIVAEEQPFKLIRHGKGPQLIPNNDKRLIKDLGIQSRTLVNFVWEDEASADARKAPTLKSQYLDEAKEIPNPALPVDGIAVKIESAEAVEKEVRSDKPKRVGKWFKGLGKK
ncbi:hypothetical protein K3495_g7236 [Podosphaera aphanis]|nr:hypothetical protein K3495_g7236 [Podosphaera aphanis]